MLTEREKILIDAIDRAYIIHETEAMYRLSKKSMTYQKYFKMLGIDDIDKFMGKTK